jgi:hypothetical protein
MKLKTSKQLALFMITDYNKLSGRMNEVKVNPSLDYFMAYPVQAVLTDEMPDSYAIEFEGNAIVVFVKKDENDLVPPEDIVGKSQLTVVRSLDGTRMIFGRVKKDDHTVEGQVEVFAPIAGYFICDPRFGGVVYYPDVPEVETAEDRAQTIREKFNGAFADGPDEGSDEV